MPNGTVSDAMVTAITQHLLASDPEIWTEERVRAVFIAQNVIATGDPVGTVRRDESSGNIATRVSVDGVHMWRINTSAGEQWNDMAPTLAWPVLYAVPVAPEPAP